MRILNRNVYVGPSQYAKFPVIRLELDLGALEQWPTARLGPGFVDALVAALPGLSEHGCSYREPGGFFVLVRNEVRGYADENSALARTVTSRADLQATRPVHGAVGPAHVIAEDFLLRHRGPLVHLARAVALAARSVGFFAR